MSNYNSRSIKDGDTTYVFVTRGRSKVFTDEEVEEFLEEYAIVKEARDEASDFEIPSLKIFAADLKSGLDFCAKKYGVSTTAVERKAGEVFPHLNLDQLTR